MSRHLNKLTARRVDTLITPGWYGDGGGLWLRIKRDGAKRWVFTWERDKKRKEMSIGPVRDVGLAQARDAATAARQALHNGFDPSVLQQMERREREATAVEPEAVATGVPLFGAFANSYIDAHEEGWKSPKHRQQWRNTITTHGALLLNKPVDAITTDDVVAVLQPIWRSIPETADRLRGRIENILDAAKASKHIASPWENPARWRGTLSHLLPRRRKKSQVKHHAAMPYEDLPAFMMKLRARPALAARAFELTILCATRTNETLKMVWSEVDLDTATWTVPPDRMKMGVEHRIPLAPRAAEILRAVAKTSNCDPNDYVFKGQRLGRPLSNMSMTMVLRRMKLGHFTVHGMRSSFRDYMGDMTDHTESLVEQALAHQIGDETTRAYRRGDAFLKRRALMADWALYLAGAPKPDEEQTAPRSTVSSQGRDRLAA